MTWPRFSFRRRRLALMLSVALVVVAAGLIVVPPAAAATVGNAIENVAENVVFTLLSTIVWAISKLFAVLTYVFISILIVVAQYNTFLKAPVVMSGWPIVRDLMNMMFIIGLIIIAAGTVLRLQNYRYNRLLGKLIIMAFLVNFSKFIAVFLLQFAQVVMLTFVNAFRDAAFGNFANMFGLDSVFAFAAKQDVTQSNGSFSIFISLVAGLAMMITAFVVTLAITVMLFVRIIALWMLIILSPIAYALRILPDTEKYASQWWSEFTKYVVLGPVLAFFLWLALAVVAATPSCEGGQKDKAGCSNPFSSDPTVQADLGTSIKANETLSSDLITNLLTVDKMVTFVVSIIFLMMGLQYAQKSGAAGAAFAGKVAQTGFGVAGAVTGFNAIRDRTIAPVQGWIKNRGAARQAAIQERTQTLEAGGDRIKARYGPTEGARERGAAAAAAYEPSRTTRVGQRQGLKNMDQNTLMQKYLNREGDERERIASMQELQSRGGLDLAQTNQNAAFQELTNVRRRGITGRRTGPTYMPESEARKFRIDSLQKNAETMTPDQLRAFLPTLTDAQERLAGVQSLDAKKALNGNDAADQALVNGVRGSLAGLPGDLKKFDDGLRRNNPRMAIETIYNGFRDGRASVDRFMTDAQQGLISTAPLTTRDHAAMINGLQNVDGLDRRQARNHINNSILQNSRTKEDYGKVMDAMDPTVRRRFIEGSELPATIAREKRDWLASKGGIGEAFAGSESTPGVSNSDTLISKYINENPAIVAELLRSGKITRNSIGSTTAMREMMDHRRIGKSGLEEAIKNNPELSNTARDTAAQVVYNTNSAPGAVADTSPQGFKENNRREIGLVLSSGGRVTNPASGREESAFDVMYGHMPVAQQDNARAARRNAIAKSGDAFKFMNMADLANVNITSDEAMRDVAINITPASLYKISESNPDVARNLADLKRSSDGRAVNTPFLGENLDSSEHTLLERQRNSLSSRNDRAI